MRKERIIKWGKEGGKGWEGGYRRNVKEKREECEGKALEVREERIIKWWGGWG